MEKLLSASRFSEDSNANPNVHRSELKPRDSRFHEHIDNTAPNSPAQPDYDNGQEKKYGVEEGLALGSERRRVVEKRLKLKLDGRFMSRLSDFLRLCRGNTEMT
ncbi:hypothetical protein L486_06131 [Kwoniella mangroviensis CBS 10435]|uniref:Uncharacterized protein n=1 Tax=Kwoniella mangroviensis CBS 10435 TaxID=1331196 RepID=A0A1B9ILD2_9TREE|nr:hypothetical protein L486_06131 [Kwoniella mangroviensis CBS 10435]